MTIYSRELADVICEGLSMGQTLRAVCRGDNMPTHATVVGWARGDVDGFAERYRLAREIGYTIMADEMIDLSDETAVDVGSVNKARLQVDTRKWLLSKALPKVFGDRLALAGDSDTPLTLEQLVAASGKPAVRSDRSGEQGQQAVSPGDAR